MNPATQRTDSFDRPGFWSFITVQFQGAFSDNLYRWLIVFYAPLLLSEDYPVTALATALFNLPWLMFPAIAGAIGDKYSKKWVTVGTKVWEVGVMILGAVAVMLQMPYLLFFTLFLMAMQSSFFSPAKYGIMPQMLPESKLSWGNGMLNMWTFIAIILGTAAAGFLLDIFASRVYLAMLVTVGFSVVGLFASLRVTPVPAAEPRRPIPVNPYSGLGGYMRLFVADARLYITMVGIAFFWFAGALVLQNVAELGKEIAPTTREASFMLTSMALGIGVGSVASGYLARGKIESGLVSIGLAGMVVTCVLLALPYEGALYLVLGGEDTTLVAAMHSVMWANYWILLVLLFALGFFGGMFDVPLAAMLQQRSPDDIKGGMIATSNVITFASMMVSAGLFFVCFNVLGLSPKTIFLVAGAFTMGMLLYLMRKTPAFVLRAGLWLVDNTLLRLHVHERRHLPEKGGALLVANHATFVDTLVLLFSTGRDVHFVVGSDLHEVRWMRRLAKLMHVIPVSPRAGESELKEVVARIRGILAAGHVVCVNDQARLHRDGPELPWHDDYTVLTRGLDVPLVPVYLSRLLEVLYVFEHGRRVRWRWPGQLRYPVHVRYGAPLPGRASAFDVRQAVQRLGMKSYIARPMRRDLLHRAFIGYARSRARRLAIADAVSGELSYFMTLAGTVVFARKLKRRLDDREMVGVLVPPSVGSVLTNTALSLMGRVPVNLNYTMPADTLASCARQCGITQVLTSRKFLERLPLEVPGEAIFLEDIRESVSKRDRVVGLLYALFAPVRLLERRLGRAQRTPDDLATVIFSSGSEGEPKGVMLTHRNILSQMDAAEETFPHHRDTCIVGFLPFFHSFGYTGTLWMPLCTGHRAVYHANPLEFRMIGTLAKKYGGTILVGTPTFLQGFIRRCTAEQLEALEFVVAGAEKLPERVRRAFYEKFGTEPLEGYGATECAPIVSVNLPDAASPGFFWFGTRHGTIGRPLPGQAVRIVDPDSQAPLPPGESGLMLVKGANIMKGYLNQPERSEKVLSDGWYETGDIAALDDDGFILITDRLARFSKIAGEMVPHTKVEETLHNLLGLDEQALAVASVPDAQKGERLVVLHTLTDEQLEGLFASMDQSRLPNLWRPRANAFYRIEEIPVLGSGKMDIKSVKKLAQAFDLGE